MRSVFLLTAIFLVFLMSVGTATGQIPLYLDQDHGHPDKIDPVHITDLINTEEFINSAIENTRIRNPELYHRVMQKAAESMSVEDYTVGDERSFFVLKFVDRQGERYTEGWFDEVDFRLMTVGEKSYIWVSIEEIGNGHVTQTEVDAILNALEDSTPPISRDPNKGIFELVEEYFGSPPNFGPNGKETGNGKTNVLLTDIKDGWTKESGGGYIAGFFFTLDQDLTHNFSNRSDIIYIDTYPGIYNPFQNQRDPSRPLSTLAHEFQHLVFHNYRGTSGEETWLNEGLSEFSEAFCGFPLRSPARYFSNTNRSMTEWAPSTTSDEVLQDYSRVALWTLYLWEQLGDDYITNLVQLPSSFGRGIQIVNRAAEEVGSEWRFPELFKHFNLANYIKDLDVDSRYGYNYSFGGRPSPKDYYNDPNVNRSGIQMPAYSSYFVEYTFGDSLEIEFTSSSNLRIKAIEVGRDATNVIPVSIGERYIQYDYGEIYRTIMFVVINQNSSSASFNYSSTGGFRYYVDEYAFDDGGPKIFSGNANFFRLPGGEENIGAGWAVKFRPEFPEHQLLQARIFAAFGQEFQGTDVPADAPKSFRFHVWGDNNGQPGNDLIEPFVVETTRENFTGDFMDIDLYDYEEELSDIQGSIYIGFTHNTEYWVAIGMTNLLNENRTFMFHPSNPNQWDRMFDLTASDDTRLNGWNMMMRTVFAVYDPDRHFPQIPDDYVLEQNFPNPFNQETKIQYGLSRDSQVKIEIYDVLGRKIKTLVDEFKAADTYTAIWDATDLRGRVVSSGVYYYRLIAGGSAITKKMIYVR